MEAVIPKGYYKIGTKVGKKLFEGKITPGKEYTLVDIFSGNYGYIADDGELHYVDTYGGWFK